ncbi:MAG: hypothetical protein LBT01_03310 [Spirochaetaceae bacterium]|nr:hypothetical protein [Spirochaetaceae bacterium]
MPESKGLADSEGYLLNLVQGVLIGDFTKLSAIKVIDRQNVLKLMAEGENDTIAEDNNIIKAGELRGADYFMMGSLQKTSSSFMLRIYVNEAATGDTMADTTVMCTASEIEDFSAVRKVSKELLERLGVELTDAGKKQLGTVVSDSDIDAEISLSRGLAAERQGGGGIINVAARNYFFHAQDYEQTAQEASMRLKEMDTQANSADLGTAIMYDDALNKAWQITLNDYENFYMNHPPFDLYYTKPNGEITKYADIKTGAPAKFSLNFSVGLRSNKDSIKIMESVLQEINTKLNATKMREKWGFSDWPRTLTLFGGPQTIHYDIEAVVENAQQQQLYIGRFTLDAGLNLENNKIGADSMQEQGIATPEITLEEGVDLEGLRIRILRVNGIDAEIAGRDGIIKIVQVDTMPKAEGASHFSTALAQEEERRQKALAQEEERKKKEKERLQKAEAMKTSRLYSRWGAYLGGGPYLEGGAGFVDFGFEGGYGLFDFELGASMLLGIHDKDNPDKYGNVSSPGFNIGAGVSFFGEEWLLVLGGGFIFHSISGSIESDETSTSSDSDDSEYETLDSVTVPYLQVRFDWLIFRIGYRLNFYPAETYIRFFDADSARKFGESKMLDSLFFGLVYLF